MTTFTATPAVVAATCSRRLHGYFLPGALADVADDEIAAQAIEAESPRVAETMQEDFIAGVARADMRIARRDRVLRRTDARGAAHVGGHRTSARVDVDAQHLAQQVILRARRVATGAAGRGRLLPQAFGKVVRIVLRAAVAHRVVQIAVRAEMDITAVVVSGKIRHAQDERPRGIGHIRSERGNRVARDSLIRRAAEFWIGTGTRVGDVELVIVRQADLAEVGVESQPQQSAFAVGRHCDREERRTQRHPVLDDLDLSVFLHDEDAPAAIVGSAHGDRLGITARHGRHRKPGDGLCGCRSTDKQECQGGDKSGKAHGQNLRKD